MQRILARFTFLSKHRPQGSAGRLPERRFSAASQCLERTLIGLLLHIFFVSAATEIRPNPILKKSFFFK
jgi:hypothetical protein